MQDTQTCHACHRAPGWPEALCSPQPPPNVALSPELCPGPGQTWAEADRLSWWVAGLRSSGPLCWPCGHLHEDGGRGHVLLYPSGGVINTRCPEQGQPGSSLRGVLRWHRRSPGLLSPRRWHGGRCTLTRLRRRHAGSWSGEPGEPGPLGNKVTFAGAEWAAGVPGRAQTCLGASVSSAVKGTRRPGRRGDGSCDRLAAQNSSREASGTSGEGARLGRHRVRRAAHGPRSPLHSEVPGDEDTQSQGRTNGGQPQAHGRLPGCRRATQGRGIRSHAPQALSRPHSPVLIIEPRGLPTGPVGSTGHIPTSSPAHWARRAPSP